jgi:hypothetical protein
LSSDGKLRSDYLPQWAHASSALATELDAIDAACSARLAAELARETASSRAFLFSHPVPAMASTIRTPMPANVFFMRITSLRCVSGSGACYLRILGAQLAAADSQRLTAASADRAAASARVAAACACSTSLRPTQPTPMVPTRASIVMLAPNLRAFIPTHLLCPE